MARGIFKTVGILCTGAGVGAVTALLYAPHSGKRTRRALRRFGTRKLDQVRDVRDNVTSYVVDRADDVRRGSHWVQKRVLHRAG